MRWSPRSRWASGCKSIRLPTSIRRLRGGTSLFSAIPRLTTTNRPHLCRIVGLPGETVNVKSDGILINGEPPRVPPKLSHTHYRSISPPTPPKSKTGQPLPTYPLKIPQDSYFVLGDNSANAYDTRFWGALPGPLIIGKAGEADCK